MGTDHPQRLIRNKSLKKVIPKKRSFSEVRDVGTITITSAGCTQ